MSSKEIKIIIFAALLWGGCGFFATTANLHSQPRTDLPKEELKMQIQAFDSKILPKSIGAWAVVGLMAASFILYMLTSLSLPRGVILGLIVFYGVGMGLCFALWYFPRADLTGTSGVLASQNYRVFTCCSLSLVASIATFGRIISVLRPL